MRYPESPKVRKHKRGKKPNPSPTKTKWCMPNISSKQGEAAKWVSRRAITPLVMPALQEITALATAA